MSLSLAFYLCGWVEHLQVLVGCDGANSVVGRWMGLPPTRYVGQIGIRGVAEFANGHDFGTTIVQYLGTGKRCGVFPFSETKVYWFYLFNSPTPGSHFTLSQPCPFPVNIQFTAVYFRPGVEFFDRVWAYTLNCWNCLYFQGRR